MIGQIIVSNGISPSGLKRAYCQKNICCYFCIWFLFLFLFCFVCLFVCLFVVVVFFFWGGGGGLPIPELKS